MPAVRNVCFTVQGFGAGGGRSQRRGQVHAASRHRGILAPETGGVVVRGRTRTSCRRAWVQPRAEPAARTSSSVAWPSACRRTPVRLTDEIAEFAQLGEYLDFRSGRTPRGWDAPGVAVAVSSTRRSCSSTRRSRAETRRSRQRVGEKIGAVRRGPHDRARDSRPHHGAEMATEALWLHQGRWWSSATRTMSSAGTCATAGSNPSTMDFRVTMARHPPPLFCEVEYVFEPHSIHDASVCASTC